MGTQLAALARIIKSAVAMRIVLERCGAPVSACVPRVIWVAHGSALRTGKADREESAPSCTKADLFTIHERQRWQCTHLDGHYLRFDMPATGPHRGRRIDGPLCLLAAVPQCGQFIVQALLRIFHVFVKVRRLG